MLNRGSVSGVIRDPGTFAADSRSTLGCCTVLADDMRYCEEYYYV